MHQAIDFKQDTFHFAVELERSYQFNDWLQMLRLFVDVKENKILPTEEIFFFESLGIYNILDYDDPLIITPYHGQKLEVEEYLAKNANQILEFELKDWCEDPSLWPTHRNFFTFLMFFNIKSHQVIYYLSDSINEEAEIAEAKKITKTNRFSITLQPKDRFVYYLNTLLIERGTFLIARRKDKNDFQNSPLFIFPKTVKRLNDIVPFLKENYKNIHDLYIKNLLNLKNPIEHDIKYDDFINFYLCNYHSSLILLH